MAGKKLKMADVSFTNLLCMLQMISSETSLIMAEKNIKIADSLRFFTFYITNLTLWVG